MSCYSGFWHGSNVSCVLKSVVCLPPLETCVLSSDTVKVSPQGGSISVSFSSGTSDAFIVSSKTDLTFISGGEGNQGLYSLGDLLDSPGQQVKRRFLMSDFNFFLWSLAFGGTVVSQDEKDSIKLFVYIYTLNYLHYRFF